MDHYNIYSSEFYLSRKAIIEFDSLESTFYRVIKKKEIHKIAKS